MTPPIGSSRTLGPDGRRYVALITLSHALQHVYFTALPLTYPLVVVEFGVSYATLGLVLSVAGIIGGLLQGAAGFYERVQTRTVFVVQTGLTAVLAVVTGASPSFGFFGAARGVGAIVTSPQHPVGASVLSRRFPERRGTVLSWHTTGGSIGTLCVPLIASALIVAFGWRWTLALFALPMLVGAALLWRYLPPDRVGVGHIAATIPLRNVIFQRRTLLLIGASSVAGAGRGLGSLTAYVPVYLGDGLHLHQILVGLVYTVLLIGSVAGPVGAGLLADRVGRRPLVIAAYLVGAVTLAIFGRVGTSLWLLLPSALAVGIFVYAESPLLQSLYSDAVQGTSSRAAFGVYFMVAFGGGSLWLVILGAVIDHFGFPAAFLVMAGSFLLAVPLVILSDSGGQPPVPVTTDPRTRSGSN